MKTNSTTLRRTGTAWMYSHAERACGNRNRQLTIWAAMAFLANCCGLMAPSARAFTITPIYETSWSNSAPAAAYADVSAVINEFQSLFSNPVTISIQFGWGDYANTNALPAGAGGVAYFPQLFQFPNTAQYTFAQTTNLMATHAAAHPENTPINTGVANFPPSYPNANGTNSFFISDAEYLALTGTAQNTDKVNAWVGMDSTTTWTYGATAGTGLFFRGALEHEISHSMGRFDIAYASATNAGPSFLTPLDFYKYNVGTTTLNPKRNVTGFSINGGTSQAFEQFNASSDTSDWNNSPTNSFNASLSTYQTMNNTDITELQALGWDPVPEPASVAVLFGGGALLVACGRRLRRK